MVLPEGQHADQQVRTTQDRRAVRGGPAERQVVAAAGAGVESVEVELLRAEADLAGGLVEGRGQLAQRRPGAGGLEVDLDDAGVRGHHERGQARVRGRRVALDDDADRPAPRPRPRSSGEQRGEVVQVVERRQEQVDERRRAPRSRPPSVARPRSRRGRGRATRRPGVRTGSSAWRYDGSGSVRASVQDTASSGRRRPAGESPGLSTSRPRRKRQVAIARAGPSRRRPRRRQRVQRQHPRPGSAPPASSGGHVGRPGLLTGRAPSGRATSAGPARPAGPRRPRAAARPGRRGRSVDPPGQPAACAGAASSAVGRSRGRRAGRARPQRDAVGAPVTGRSASGASGSPGYHLPWPRCTRAPRVSGAEDHRSASRSGEGGGERALLLTVGVGVPLRALHVVDRDEGRLPAHRQLEPCVRQQRRRRRSPSASMRDHWAGGVGLGDPGVLVEAGDHVGEVQGDLARVDRAADRGRAGGVRGGREGDVALAGEQRRGRVETDPAGAGHERPRSRRAGR